MTKKKILRLLEYPHTRQFAHSFCCTRNAYCI